MEIVEDGPLRHRAVPQRQRHHLDGARSAGWSADGYCKSTSREVSRLHRDGPPREVVLLELVAELPERHVQQLGSLRLHASCALERDLKIATFELVQGRVQIETVVRHLDDVGLPSRTLATDRFRKRF